MQANRVAPEKHQPRNTDVSLSFPSHFTCTKHTRHDVCLSCEHLPQQRKFPPVPSIRMPVRDTKFLLRHVLCMHEYSSPNFHPIRTAFTSLPTEHSVCILITPITPTLICRQITVTAKYKTQHNNLIVLFTELIDKTRDCYLQ